MDNSDQQNPLQILTKTDMFSKIGLNATKIAERQMLDESLKPFIEYLRDDKFPESHRKARRLLLEVSDYVILDDIMYHFLNTKAKRKAVANKYKLVVPNSLVDTILRITLDYGWPLRNLKYV